MIEQMQEKIVVGRLRFNLFQRGIQKLALLFVELIQNLLLRTGNRKLTLLLIELIHNPRFPS